MFANDFAQATPNTISHDRLPDSARSDKASAKPGAVGRRNNAKQDQLAAINLAVLLYVVEFRGQR
ncbi:MAG: hypothetical protein QOE81_496 [Verrucomicrobiota bacterium]